MAIRIILKVKKSSKYYASCNNWLAIFKLCAWDKNKMIFNELEGKTIKNH